VDSFKILRGLGYGLDESAIDTIAARWRFKPGNRDGEPVDVQARIEVVFRLFNRPEDRGELNAYPLRIQIIDAEWNQESSGNWIGSGYGNLYPGVTSPASSPRGFAYTCSCSPAFRRGKDFPAKWNEPESRLEIVTGVRQGAVMKTCEFTVTMQTTIFTLKDGKPVAVDSPTPIQK
jgi:hypothetical protein